MTPAPRILVFDSGIGGLSILQALRQQLSGCEFTYASDNAAFPYGLKTQSFLIERVDTVLKALIKELHPDIIVVACNTASTVVLPSIRNHFKAPVVGVVPAIKPAAELSNTGVIGLLGTPGTVARDYTQQLINDFASDSEIVTVGSSQLVEIAEQALRGTSPDITELGEILAPFFVADKLDTIVLACTHFPLIIEALKAAAPREVQWLDSGQAVARRVGSLVPKASDHQNLSPQTSIKTLFTRNSRDIYQLREALRNFGCDDIRFCEELILREGQPFSGQDPPFSGKDQQ